MHASSAGGAVKKARASAAGGSTSADAAATPGWLPVYPGSKPEGVSVMIDPQTGKRIGSYFFRTPDEIKQTIFNIQVLTPLPSPPSR